MRARMKTERRSHFLVARSGQSFRHYVCQHLRRLTVFKVHFATLDFVTNVMVLDVDVLCTAVVDRILSHLDARLIVFKDLSSGPDSLAASRISQSK